MFEKLLLGKCEATGLELNFDNNSKNYDGRLLDSPSIDKFNPKGNYTKDNCRIVCWWFNAAKGQYTDEQVIDMCRRIINKIDVEIS